MIGEIDTFNHFLVGIHGDEITIMAPRRKMNKSSALNLAAYLVALADPHQEQFAPLLKAILET